MEPQVDMSVYKPNEPREPKVPLNARVPKELRDALVDVVRLWRIYAEQRGDESEGIDLSYVVRRLLRVGIDQAFAEFGGRPEDEHGWMAIERAISKTMKKYNR